MHDSFCSSDRMFEWCRRSQSNPFLSLYMFELHTKVSNKPPTRHPHTGFSEDCPNPDHKSSVLCRTLSHLRRHASFKIVLIRIFRTGECPLQDERLSASLRHSTYTGLLSIESIGQVQMYTEYLGRLTSASSFLSLV